ncbi:MAG: hypothetical protein A4S17_00485 [Proteobacteria bacterium HN_bin10]|nr:MAG: hypothetical protein A4S17_00485 [Proteobacteria bacterium HN_bin10]
MSTGESLPLAAKPRASEPGFERITVNMPRGPLLQRLKREATASGASVSATAVRALARGLAGKGDAEDRLLKLERRLGDHMKASARDAMIQQELLVVVARTLLLHGGFEEDATETMEMRADAMVDRMLARVLANITAGRVRDVAAASETDGQG